MKGDLILRVIISFLIPFLLLFAFFSITNYTNFGFYSFLLSFSYFMLAYILFAMRFKVVSAKSLIFLRKFGYILIVLFMLLIIFITVILLNIKMPFIYEYIRF